ncbi:MAG TPA: transaldolase [Kofleriaceae bacterium]|jgi:transaldolase|nr:transaldolase [Kofleriaceae bacterium]
MTKLPSIQIFADGAVLEDVGPLIERYAVKGFTTNPTLMAKAGIRDYEGFARKILAAAGALPVSLEVFADDMSEMERQARKLASWGDNVFVKIPITNTRRESTHDLVRSLSAAGVKLNVTAVLTTEQVDRLVPNLAAGVPAIVSVFAGRIADTGVDAVPIVRHAVEALRGVPRAQVLWASCREIYNIVQAASAGCHIVTVPNDMLKKLDGLGRDLGELSLDTVKMFRNDALASGFVL